jgi:hypothetical protein
VVHGGKNEVRQTAWICGHEERYTRRMGGINGDKCIVDSPIMHTYIEWVYGNDFV